MAFNPTDFTKAPWASGVMTLTHDECVHVLTACEKIKEDYPVESADTFYVISQYNMIDWKKGINGDTYAVLQGYDMEVNTMGINEQGVILEAQEEEAVVEEVPQENEEVTPAE